MSESVPEELKSDAEKLLDCREELRRAKNRIVELENEIDDKEMSDYIDEIMG